ncbi:Ig-like domain-containing protein [Butyrivibrio sp. INlla21]|uniref:Ig-like domain-containing protein n=1 Tax=Butyrivibrio sp. INlla21 TaxID=1520811 RepID=UPI0008EAF6F3|nr:Ig-like domain-containing protein [Butyrivibrio sp. INlla21]SFU76976.1 Ig-like domain (group 3) [Butyrivibrio sp. INlla21]
MKKTSLWSLALKRLLPIILSLSLLIANFDSLQVSAGEPGEEPAIVDEEPTQEPTEDNDQNDDSDKEDGADDQSSDDVNNPDNNKEVNSDNKSDNPVQNEETLPAEGNPANEENPDAQLADGEKPEGAEEGEGVLLDENGNPIDPSILLPKNIQAKNMNSNDNVGMNEPEEVIISFEITDPNNNESKFELFEGRYEPKDNERYYPGGGSYTTSHVEKEDDKVTARVSFYYDIDDDYEVSSVSCDGAKEVEHNPSSEYEKIVCHFEDLKKGENNYTLNITVKKIDEVDPVIESVTVAEGTPTYTCDETGLTAFSTSSSNLSVTAKATDDKGIDSVYVVADYDDEEELFEMSLGTEDTYTWNPNHHGNYKIKKVIAEDRAGNTAEFSEFSPKALCYYEADEMDDLDVSLQTGKGESKDEEWHSEVIDGQLMINVAGSTSRKIQSVIVTGIDGNTAAQSELKNTKFEIDQNIPVPTNKEGKTEYKVSVLFYGDTDPIEIDSKTAWIDNTAPSAEIKIEVDDRVQDGSNKHGHHSYNEDVDMLIKVPAKCDGEAEGKDVSGFYKIVYTVKTSENDSPQVFEKDIHERDRRNSDEEFIVFSQTLTAEEGQEVEYEITVDSISDAAGNTANDSQQVEGMATVDKGAPQIVYSSSGKKREAGDFKFYSGEISGTVTIRDRQLDKESIKFVPEKNEIEDGYTYLTPKLIQEEEQDYKVTYEFNTSEDGEYIVKTYARDTTYPTNHETTAFFKYLILDNTAPEIDISYDKSEPSEGGENFYNSNVGVTVKINDKWLDEEKSVVKVKKVDQYGAESDMGIMNDFSGDLGDEEHTLSFTTDGDGIYNVYVEAYDMSGNHSEKTGAKFTIDATTPEVEISFDKNDPMNEKYYNETRTATVTVTDFTFSEELAGLKVEEKYGTAEIGGWTQSGPFTYTCTVTFEKDGQYELSCQSEDKAHNKSEEKSEPEFVIDKTAPQIQVNYNGAEAANGNFYKDTRIASVNIKEMSFDDKLVEITTQPLSEGGTLPATGGFSSSDDQNIASITFDEDGTYGYVINCTDLAGNKAENYISDVFIIDKTVPEVTFSGVENKSANNAEVAPSVKYGDKYIDLEKSNVVLTGANNGVISVGNSITPTEDGFIVNYSDFAHDKSMDDMYTLKAYVYDKAGNAAEEELVFSVNRHGSVFVVDEGTRALNEMFYVKEPVDVKITEINIDDLTAKNVSVSRDNSDVISLKEGKNYTVSKQGDDESWKTFTYTIKRSNFERDGVYSISISTQDRASNKQDNKSRDADVTFAVDMTSPSVVAAGIEENGIYEETSHSFNVDVNDNMGVESLLVYVDGKVVGNYDQLAIDSGEDMSFTLDESEETRTITMIAEDFAGNKEVKVISGVLVSTKPIDVKGIGGGNGLGGKTHKPVADTMRTILFIILAGASVASVAGASVLLYRRKIR